MKNNKLEKFVELLNKNRRITFYLYNVKYIITITNNNFLIKQLGVDYIHSYSNITDLFKEYRIYGLSLAELWENIRIIN